MVSFDYFLFSFFFRRLEKKGDNNSQGRTPPSHSRGGGVLALFAGFWDFLSSLGHFFFLSIGISVAIF